MEIFVKVNENDIRLSVNYFRGRCVSLSAVYVTRDEFGYSYDPCSIGTCHIISMKRRNQKQIDKICALVEKHKQTIATLYTRNKLNALAEISEFTNI